MCVYIIYDMTLMYHTSVCIRIQYLFMLSNLECIGAKFRKVAQDCDVLTISNKYL